jgi:hypothetical protein
LGFLPFFGLLQLPATRIFKMIFCLLNTSLESFTHVVMMSSGSGMSYRHKRVTGHKGVVGSESDQMRREWGVTRDSSWDREGRCRRESTAGSRRSRYGWRYCVTRELRRILAYREGARRNDCQQIVVLREYPKDSELLFVEEFNVRFPFGLVWKANVIFSLFPICLRLDWVRICWPTLDFHFNGCRIVRQAALGTTSRIVIWKRDDTLLSTPPNSLLRSLGGHGQPGFYKFRRRHGFGTRRALTEK